MRRQFQNWILFFCLLQNHLSGFESDDMLWSYNPTLHADKNVEFKVPVLQSAFPTQYPITQRAILLYTFFSVTLLKWAYIAVVSLCITHPLIQVIYFSTFLFIDSCGIAASPRPWSLARLFRSVHAVPRCFPRVSIGMSPEGLGYIDFFFLPLQKAYTQSHSLNLLFFPFRSLHSLRMSKCKA